MLFFSSIVSLLALVLRFGQDKPLQIRPDTLTESRAKTQVLIRRPAHTKPRPRARLHNETVEPENSPAKADVIDLPESTSNLSLQRDSEPQDELARIRVLLRPPLTNGVTDWGIPPATNEPWDPALEAKLAGFLAIKRDPVGPKHFNDSLMANRSFRNPHLYTKLVEFVDVNERATNFPPELWNPNELQEGWFADRIGM
ncbi:uncharacterized protein FIBRA_00748 [Fibroporia radiculosa]|uniref:HCNGP-domain-containing protein n=1 Tax=Fibroporia radiculosa TaxID=599839 RepID=J4G0K9_9APHY|nr:uncharacterized protein FIBRA_00748 [Fibroporia radiculosa]CCL98743.1 predicted protein [Fibroporia radiculosa]